MLNFTYDLGGLTYPQYRFDLIKKLEGFISTVYADTKGIPTIGYGFNLRIPEILKAVIDTVAPTLTTAQRLELKVIFDKTYLSGTTSDTTTLHNTVVAKMTEFHAVNSAIPTDLVLTPAQSYDTFLAQVTEYEGKVDNWLSGISGSTILTIPQSVERAVFLSMAYNGLINTGVSPALRQAVIDGNRAEAWYQIRYTNNGSGVSGVANRHYVESERFGLYDDHSVTHISTKDNAHQAAVMYTEHRDAILLYESRFSTASATTAKGETIQDIYHEMQPAIEYLKGEYGVLSSFTIEEVQLIPETSSTFFSNNLNGDGTAYDSANNDQDLLIGNSAVNTLNGGVGNDALVGGKGNDTLTGGAGNDQFIINSGDGADAVTDPEDGDRVVVNGSDSFKIGIINAGNDNFIFQIKAAA